MKDPQYGTEPPSSIPQLDAGTGAKARVLAGTAFDRTGPFQTKQDVQMLDFELEDGGEASHSLPPSFDTCLVYVYEGEGSVGSEKVSSKAVAVFDASTSGSKTFTLRGGAGGMNAMLFAGVKLKEPLAWHGPIVMNTQDEIRSTFMEMQMRRFPPVRASWDYRVAKSNPNYSGEKHIK